MTYASRPSRRKLKMTLKSIAEKMAGCHPRTILLFGSAAAFLEDPVVNPAPNDLDILLVADNPLGGISLNSFDPPIELHRFRIGEATAVARSLRYDTRALALSKLYAKNVAKQHARDVILASLLLGPSYNAFGIEQIDVDGRPDSRDYSRHRVLYGHDWWKRMSDWARERRSFFERLADKAIGADRFE
ncbi:MAG: hypothetical protein P8X55_18380 [Desulfosarcinaceae bacterium]